jgi:hypothetical protein
MSRSRRVAVVAALLASSVPAVPLIVNAAAPPVEGHLAAVAAGWEGEQAPRSFTDLRPMNPEYDFMARTFTVLALADHALSTPASVDADLQVIDTILRDTLRYDDPRHWLLPYADASPWRGDGHSLFVDGEILVMLGARRFVRDDRPEWQAETQRRAAAVVANLERNAPLPLAESYPNEGWTFCHTMALVGLRMHEVLDGADHDAVRDAWVTYARAHLVDADTGLLISEFTMDGAPQDGPEGSSLWFPTVALRLIDPALADAQYAGAKQALGGTVFGWGYAREWPAGSRRYVDVDSGPIVPLIDASASSSGFAIVASRAAGDDDWNRALVHALAAANAVMAVDPSLAAAADNTIGQSVIAWGLGFGPLWARVGPPSPG